MKFQDSSFNSLKVTVGTESVTHPRTHSLTDAPKAICPINFFKVGGIMTCLPKDLAQSFTLVLFKNKFFFCSLLNNKKQSQYKKN